MKALIPLLLIAMAAPTWAATMSVEEAVALARQANPRLAAQRSTTAAMGEIPSQQGALPDPTLMLNAANVPVDSFSTADENMTQMQIGVTQKIPFPGKLSLKEEAAQHKATSAQWGLIDREYQIDRNVRDGWWRLFFLDRAVETIRKNRDLMRQLVRIAESKYSLGAGLQQDALLAQLELTRLIDREQELTAVRERMEATFNGLLGRKAVAPVSLPHRVDETLLPLKPTESLVAVALEKSPKITSRDEEERSAQARLDIARKGYYPDMTVGAVYGVREDNPVTGQARSDMATLSLGLSIPLWGASKQSREIAQRGHEVETERWMTEATRDDIAVAVASFAADYRRARQRAILYRTGVIPLATQTVASMEAGYQVNKVDFLNVVRARISLYNDEIEYWKSLSAAHQAVAALIATMGGEKVYE